MGNDFHEKPAPPSRPSFSPVFIIILGVVIFFLGPLVGKVWALVLASGLLGFVLWQAFSPGQYDEMKKTYPDMARSDWILNNLLHHLLIPAALIGGFYACLRFLK